MEFNNVAAIVTGGASGLGEGTVRALAAEGCRVAIFDLQEERGEALAKEVGGIFVRCDVSSAESAEAAFNTAREAHGLCGIAVNCAGIAPAAKIVGREGPMALDAFNRVIQVNLVGSFNIMRLAAAESQCRWRARHYYLYRVGGSLRRPDWSGGLQRVQRWRGGNDAAIGT